MDIAIFGLSVFVLLLGYWDYSTYRQTHQRDLLACAVISLFASITALLVTHWWPFAIGIVLKTLIRMIAASRLARRQAAASKRLGLHLITEERTWVDTALLAGVGLLAMIMLMVLFNSGLFENPTALLR